MPGKSALPLSANKSKERTGSSTSDSKKRRDQDIQKISIWPEWTEAELAAEKWDIAGGKGKDKKTPLPGALFEDPDGHVLLPSALNADYWKRPSEYLLDQVPNMVISEDTVDLVTANGHLYNSTTMLWIISQLTALWNVRSQLAAGGLGQTVAAISSVNPSSMSGSDNNDTSTSQHWKPWEHIYPQSKGQSLPSYNPAGKYCVRLHWMGCWRKVTVDDQLPFDAQDQLLLPATTNPTELWPAILCKAILKIMSLDYTGGSEWCEFGEASPVQMITGWLPHTITIRKDSVELWDKLSAWLPLWKRPQPFVVTKQPDTATPTAPLHNKHLDVTLPAEGKPRSMEGKRHKGISAHQLAATAAANSAGAAIQPVTSSEMTRAIVLASYSHPPDWYPVQQSVKQELAAGSELLTENRLPVDLPHSVLLTQVRDEPLELPPKEPPPPVIQLPYYLGLRHRSKLPTDPRSPSPRPREPKWVKLNTPLLSKPPVVTPSEDTSEETSSEEKNKAPLPVATEPADDNNSSWISYEDFISSFNVLHVFYNPVVFCNHEMYQDLRNTVVNSAIPVSLSSKKGAAVSSIVISSSKILSGPVALVPVILSDSTEPVEITICFSSLSNWLDGQRISRTKKLPTLGLLPPPVTSSEATSGTDNDGANGPNSHQRFREVLPSGVLLVEPYCWKDIVLKPPVLSMTTTAVQTAILSLPPGRHIYRLQVMAPLGYHVELLSDHYFILTNEDAVFVHMSDESKVMVSHCTKVIGNLLEMATTPVIDMDTASHAPSLLQDQATKIAELELEDDEIRKRLYKVLCTSILYGLCSMQQQLQLTTVMLFAWRAFLHLIYHLVGGADQLNMDTSTLAPIVRKNVTAPDNWQDREPTSEELLAVTKLQGEMRRYLTNKISKCLQTGSTEHVGMMDQVTKSAELIAPHCEQLGRLIFNTVFQLDEELFKHFPYYENEEKHRAYHQDYNGSYSELPLNHWSLLFREVFYVQEPGLVMLPRLTLPPTTALLRVIDNDSGVEVPCLFQKVIPHYYKSNKMGYTILGEVWSRDDIIDSGEWQLRLVGSSPLLPHTEQSSAATTAAAADDASSTTTNTIINITPSLYTHEVMDYYLPDKNNCFLRYLLKVKKNEACAITVQVKTSKSDAFIKLQILDREESICSAKGKGHVVLPICWLQPDPVTNAIDEENEENAVKGHKYMIEGTIMRDSWPANESAWSYINMLKNVEKLEDGHAGADKPPSGRRQKPAKGPKTAGGGGRERAGSVMQHRQQIDVSKAHWILRVVTPSTDAIHCVKDTEKEDELKAMMDAWETKQPGRAKKALESRRKYLEECKQQDVIEVGDSDNMDASSPPAALVSDADNAVTFTSLPLPEGPAMVKRVDYNKYMINVGAMPHMLQSEEVEQRKSQWQRQLMEYRQQRQTVLEKRKEDVHLRNIMKKQQIELAEQWQEEFEQSRLKMNEARNAIRERFLAVQQRQKEEQAALLAAQTSVDTAGGRDSKAKGKSAAKGKKK